MAVILFLMKAVLFFVSFSLVGAGLYFLNAGAGGVVRFPDVSILDNAVAVGDGEWPFGAVVAVAGAAMFWLTARWKIAVRRKYSIRHEQRGLLETGEEEALFSRRITEKPDASGEDNLS